MDKKKTIIVDLDGCVLKHYGIGATKQWRTFNPLPNVLEAFDAWERDGHCIVLMSARKECCRFDLEVELRTLGLFWDHLILGVPSGERVLINDRKPDVGPSCRAICVSRNVGLNGGNL